MKKNRKTREVKEYRQTFLLFILLLCWIVLQGVNFASNFITAGVVLEDNLSLKNVTSETATVTFRVLRPPEQAVSEVLPVEEKAGAIAGVWEPTREVQEPEKERAEKGEVTVQEAVEIKEMLINIFQDIFTIETVDVQKGPEIIIKSETLATSETIVRYVEASAAAVSEPEAQTAIQLIAQDVSEGKRSVIPITEVRITNYEGVSKETGEAIPLAQIEKHFFTEKGSNIIEVIEIVPEHVAPTTEYLHFPEQQPIILQKDPVLKWIFEEGEKEQNRTIRYYVFNKTIEKDETITIITGVSKEKTKEHIEEIPALPQQKGGIYWPLILLGILFIFIILLHFIIKKYKQKNKRKPHSKLTFFCFIIYLFLTKFFANSLSNF